MGFSLQVLQLSDLFFNHAHILLGVLPKSNMTLSGSVGHSDLEDVTQSETWVRPCDAEVARRSWAKVFIAPILGQQ